MSNLSAHRTPNKIFLALLHWEKHPYYHLASGYTLSLQNKLSHIHFQEAHAKFLPSSPGDNHFGSDAVKLCPEAAALLVQSCRYLAVGVAVNSRREGAVFSGYSLLQGLHGARRGSRAGARYGPHHHQVFLRQERVCLVILLILHCNICRSFLVRLGEARGVGCRGRANGGCRRGGDVHHLCRSFSNGCCNLQRRKKIWDVPSNTLFLLLSLHAAFAKSRAGGSFS